jgi:Fe-S-cluster containining protein
MADQHSLDCMKCPALCCRMAGYVTVSPSDIARLARFLGLSVRAFEAKHIVRVTRAGRKRIKAGNETCQFLGSDRRCTVYPARPTDCGGYYCWEHRDPTVYEFARFVQTPVTRLRKEEAQEATETTASPKPRQKD